MCEGSSEEAGNHKGSFSLSESLKVWPHHGLGERTDAVVVVQITDNAQAGSVYESSSGIPAECHYLFTVQYVRCNK